MSCCCILPPQCCQHCPNFRVGPLADQWTPFDPKLPPARPILSDEDYEKIVEALKRMKEQQK